MPQPPRVLATVRKEHPAPLGRILPPKPLPPKELAPSSDWEYFELWEAVRDALQVLPSLFTSDLVISGVRATDLHAFNTSLGASIEDQVVSGLNASREATWDKEGKYTDLRFVRQAQTFPDVVLKPAAPPHVEAAPVLGIELKGWYVLAKEGVPSFRYKVTPKAAAPHDLLVVFPWALSQVISGAPQLFEPFVASARYAAEYRNWWWEHERESKGDSSITVSSHEGFYPIKSDEIADVPAADSGNFGRIARTKIFHRDGYINATFKSELSGIPLDAWKRFFQLFTENNTEEQIRQALDRMAAQKSRTARAITREKIELIDDHLKSIAGLLADI
jgi:hypothetical protein